MHASEPDTLIRLVGALQELSEVARGTTAPADVRPDGRARLLALQALTVDLARDLPPETSGVGLVAEYYAWRVMRGMEPSPDFLRLQRLFEREVAASDFPRLPLVIA